MRSSWASRVAVVVGLFGCGASDPRTRSPASADPLPPPIVDPVPAAIVFAPAAAAATHYNARTTPGDPGPLDKAVLAVIAPMAASATLDPRLAKTCAELAAVVPADGQIGDDWLELARQRNGIIEPSVSVLVVSGDPDKPAAIVDLLRSKLAPEMMVGPAVRVGVGVGTAEHGIAPVVVAIVRSSIASEPIPRTLEARGSFTLDATVHPRMHDPEVEVRRGDRVDRAVVAAAAGGRFTSQIACAAEPGRLDVEIHATNPRGRVMLARFAVWCGAPPPVTYIAQPPSTGAGIDQPEQVERVLISLVNRDRIAAGVAPLVLDPPTAADARRHAEALRDHAAPVAPAPGVVSSAVYAEGIAAAYERLANTPDQRAAMLAPDVTHLGAGIAWAEKPALVAALRYRRIASRVDLDATRRTIAARLTNRDRVVDQQLADLARQFASRIAAGRTEQDTLSELNAVITRQGFRYERIDHAASVAQTVDLAPIERMIAETQPEDVGIAVVQADHPKYGKNAIWVVVFVGRRSGFQSR